MCTTSGTIINLWDQLNGADPGGYWELVDCNNPTIYYTPPFLTYDVGNTGTFITDCNLSIFSTQNMPDSHLVCLDTLGWLHGNYCFQYTVTGSANCPPVTSLVTITVEDKMVPVLTPPFILCSVCGVYEPFDITAEAFSSHQNSTCGITAGLNNQFMTFNWFNNGSIIHTTNTTSGTDSFTVGTHGGSSLSDSTTWPDQVILSYNLIGFTCSPSDTFAIDYSNILVQNACVSTTNGSLCNTSTPITVSLDDYLTSWEGQAFSWKRQNSSTYINYSDSTFFINSATDVVNFPVPAFITYEIELVNPLCSNALATNTFTVSFVDPPESGNPDPVGLIQCFN